MEPRNDQIAGLNTWLTLRDFYAADPRREASAQMDFPGSNERWTDRTGWRWILYFVKDTDEFVAQRVDHYEVHGARYTLGSRTIKSYPAPSSRDEHGPVVLLGSAPRVGDQEEWVEGRRLHITQSYERLSFGGFTIGTEIADVIVGDIQGLVTNPDFMSIVVDRINVGSRLLAALFIAADNPVYSVAVNEVDARLARGEAYYVEPV